MAKTTGYLITFTTYGTWLQGDPRGYVKNSQTGRTNPHLMHANRFAQSADSVVLSKKETDAVADAIRAEAALRGQAIHALAVRPTHVHIAAGYTQTPIGAMVAYYKKAGRKVLKRAGRDGKVWTKGYDVRFCFSPQDLKVRTAYVKNHNA